MLHDQRFGRDDIDTFVAPAQFGRVSMRLIGWWKFFLEGLCDRSRGRETSHGSLVWKTFHFPLALIGREFRPISEADFGKRLQVGLPVGTFEWAYVAKPQDGAEVIIVLLSGPDRQEEVRVYANELSATSQIHHAGVLHRLARRYPGRQPLEPLPLVYQPLRRRGLVLDPKAIPQPYRVIQPTPPPAGAQF